MFLISGKTVNPDFEAELRAALEQGRVANPAQYADFMLNKVSRTFALNIQVLPAGLKRQVMLAYLFCRMADTLEDDEQLETSVKIRLLAAFRDLFPPGLDGQEKLASFQKQLPAHWRNSDKWDRLLVFHCHWIFSQFRELPHPAIGSISACVEEMCGGMLRFTDKLARISRPQLLIESLEDLDEYCYYVAGTVGNLLCELFAQHSRLIGRKRALALKSLSVSFGLGLQLTNILKDIGEDSQRNVSYIPHNLLARENLTETAFLAPDGREGSLRIFDTLIRKAKAHLEDALEYSCLLPRLEPRLRLFCLWPLFMAAETLVSLGENRRTLQGGPKVKISRDQVKRIISRTSLACWSNSLVRSLFTRTMARLDALVPAPTGARL